MAVKVGLIGLGNMGEPMAVNIAKAGFDLTVCDRRPEPLEALRALGASVAGSPRELAAHCDLIHIVVVDDAQVEAVLMGDNGVFAGVRSGSRIAIHSTIRPESCRRFAGLARSKGAGLIDAPVSGGAMGAQAATLALMVGGEESDVEACMPVMRAVGKNIFRIGGVGTGQTAKLANNLVGLINLEATREGLRLARLSGIGEAQMLEILKASTGNSWMVQNWEARKKVVASYTGSPENLGKVRYKDMMLALAAGRDVGVDLPFTALATQFTHRTSND